MGKMVYTRVCLREACGKIYTTTYAPQKYCSRSCGASEQAVRTPDDIRAYMLKNILMPTDPDACWEWQGHISKKTGYGVACFDGYHYQAHRVSYETFIGPIPEGLHVLHVRHCFLRRCVNPRHLYTGTNQQNMDDKVAVGRALKGSNSPVAKLTEAKVLLIFESYFHKGVTIAALAKQYNVARANIRHILQRKLWRHVDSSVYPPYEKSVPSVTADDVRAIRTLYADGVSSPKIATKFGITPQQARNIIHRRSWANIA